MMKIATIISIVTMLFVHFAVFLSSTAIAAPLNLSKSDGLTEGECTITGGTINYTLCYDKLPNTEIVTDVTITDTLPIEALFVSADNGGTYDATTHTVTWNIGSLDAEAVSSCVHLSGDTDAQPGTILTNTATIDSNESDPAVVEENTEICPVSVYIDIKPGGCPTPLNVGSKGVLPVAVLGTADFDITTIDPQSITLAGVPPLRWSMEDVATPYDINFDECSIYDCHEATGDGYVDLTLKFDTQEIAAAIEEVYDRECLILELTGDLKTEYGGLPFKGGDVVSILKKGRKHNIAPTNLILLKQ